MPYKAVTSQGGDALKPAGRENTYRSDSQNYEPPKTARKAALQGRVTDQGFSTTRACREM